MEYWGDLNLIQTLINHGSIQTIASYNDAFESLVYMQNHIYDISLYLLFNSMKFLGVFAISGDIYTEPQNFKLNFYYGDTIPTEIYNCINKILNLNVFSKCFYSTNIKFFDIMIQSFLLICLCIVFARHVLIAITTSNLIIKRIFVNILYLK